MLLHHRRNIREGKVERESGERRNVEGWHCNVKRTL
jgi:hypothetical protein